jgi:hypothetical protein
MMGAKNSEVSREALEGANKPVVFHVATRGLEESIHEVISDEESKKRESEDGFEPNLTWQTVKVSSEAEKKRWVTLKNEWLNLAWTPNQSPDERVENGKRMKEIEQELKEIEK